MNIFYFFFFYFPLLIFFDPTTVCDLPSSPPPPLVRTVTYGYLPTYLHPAYLCLSALLKAVLKVLWWWFWLCLQTLGILCPHRLVPLALFGLTEPSDPLRFVRPQPKSPPFSLNYPLSTFHLLLLLLHRSGLPSIQRATTQIIAPPNYTHSARNGSSFLAFFHFTFFLFFRHPAID